MPSSACRVMMVTADTIQSHAHTLVAAAAKPSSRTPSNAASTALMKSLEMLSVCLPRAHRAHTAAHFAALPHAAGEGLGRAATRTETVV